MWISKKFISYSKLVINMYYFNETFINLFIFSQHNQNTGRILNVIVNTLR